MNIELAARSEASLSKRFALQIIRSNPGLVDRAEIIAKEMVDSGLPPSFVAMLIQVIYNPSVPSGQGQTTRLMWFQAAVMRRYGDKLKSMKMMQLRSFLSDMEEVDEMRNILQGEGYDFSFEEVFTFWELGTDADTLLNLIVDACSKVTSRIVVKKQLVKAAQIVQARGASDLETVLNEIQHGYEYDATELLDRIKERGVR